MHIHMYVYAVIRKFKQVHACIHTYTHTHLHLHLHMHMHVHIRAQTHARTHTHRRADRQTFDFDSLHSLCYSEHGQAIA